MKSSAKKVELASVDDLFSTEESRADAQREKVLEIPLSELHPFKNHPFKVKDDEAMMETADSIRQYGVLVPAIARPDPNGGYELVAGHRRHRGSELAGKDTMPVIVRDLDDDQATIIMVDSNLQRESLLPSERAFAYKMKLEAMKRQAGRPSKNSAQLGRNFDGKESREILAEQVGQSRNQISRYIRLTELIPELLDMVDEKKIAFNPAYDKATNKQFITVQTKTGNTFYVVIDYDAPINEEEEQYQTYFLNMVDEADLLALLDEETASSLTTCNCDTRCEAGAVNTECPVCKTNMSECTGAVPEPEEPVEGEETEVPEEPENASPNIALIIGIIALVGIGGGAYYYFKFVRGKKQKDEDLDFFDDEGYEEEPYINEDDEPVIADDEDDEAETRETEETI